MRDLGEFIREQRRQAQLSLRKLSEQAGISNPYLSQIERGLRKPSAEILQAIAKALRISAETLYMRAGILDAESSGSDVVSAILRDNSITEGQKQTLIEVYHSLRLVNARSHQRPDTVVEEAGEVRSPSGDETTETTVGSEEETSAEATWKNPGSHSVTGEVAEDGDRDVAVSR